MSDYTYDYIAHLRFACERAGLPIPSLLENQIEQVIEENRELECLELSAASSNPHYKYTPADEATEDSEKKVLINDGYLDLLFSPFRTANVTRFIRKLDLSHNKLTDEGAANLVEFFAADELLTDLNLANNNIGEHGAVAIASLLGRVRSLECLNLSRNWIGTAGAKALAHGIQIAPDLWDLSVADAGIDLIGATEICRAVASNSNIKRFDISGNITITAAMQSPSLDVEHAASQFGFVEELSNMIRKNVGLEELIICRLGIQASPAIDFVAPSITLSRSLKVVRLSANPLGRDGCCAIAQALAKNSSLIRLEMPYCGMDDTGLEAMTQAITTREGRLAFLDISGNMFSKLAARHFLQQVACHPPENINMWGNWTRTDGLLNKEFAPLLEKGLANVRLYRTGEHEMMAKG